MYSVEQIVQATGALRAHVITNWPALVDAMRWQGIYDHFTEIAMIATVAVETGVTVDGVNLTFSPVKELGGENARYAPWYGRGDIQCTWESNYALYGPRLSPPLNLLADPDLLLQTKPSAQMAALYFKDRNIAPMARAHNWQGVRVAVNGGLSGWAYFIGVVNALLNMAEPGEFAPVTTVAVPALLYQRPGGGPVAIAPDHQPMGPLPIGTIIRFTPDPHLPGHPTINGPRDLWAHCQLDKSPVHGWYQRALLSTH